VLTVLRVSPPPESEVGLPEVPEGQYVLHFRRTVRTVTEGISPLLRYELDYNLLYR
jgi:hypothetical protein